MPLSHVDRQLLDTLHLTIDIDPNQKIEHLMKVVRLLWRQVEQLESMISTSKGQITLRTGSAAIDMKSDGTIEIKGNNIAIRGSGNIDIKGAKVT
jgi:hypothetical protein